jgi:methylmalonyl-CoA mutase N-terminal domain/subunit
VADVFRFVADEQMSFNPISISGYHMREAGATAAQEIGFTLANALEYVRVAVRRGLAVDSFGPRLSFFFASHNDLFEEAAKFRAADASGPGWFASGSRPAIRPPAPLPHPDRRGHPPGAAAAQQRRPGDGPGAGGVLGGTQSLHTNGTTRRWRCPPRSPPPRAPDPQILGYESGVAGVIDPLGGSYYVESLTDRLEADVARLIEEWTRSAGARAIERGTSRRRSRGVRTHSSRRRSRAIGCRRGQPVYRRLTAAHIPTPDFSALETASARGCRGAPRTAGPALDASGPPRHRRSCPSSRRSARHLGDHDDCGVGSTA